MSDYSAPKLTPHGAVSDKTLAPITVNKKGTSGDTLVINGQPPIAIPGSSPA